MQVWVEFFLFLSIAVPVTLIDVRHYCIPDSLSIGGTVLFVALKLLFHEQTLGLIAIELGAGFGVFWVIWKLTEGQIGLGDAKYSAFIAVAAGMPGWLVSLFVASVTGLAFAGLFIGLFRADRRTRIPFAPFLTIGAVFAIFIQKVPDWRLMI